jgi:hypothetical protein
VIDDVDFYKGQQDRAQSPVTLQLSSSTMNCSQISSIARMLLGVYSTEPFCTNPLFNMTSFWNASSCMLSIVGRSRQDGSIIVPHNSVQFDYKELSSYFLCIEAQFSDYSGPPLLLSNATFHVAISITDMFSDPRQNKPIPVVTTFTNAFKYYASFAASTGLVTSVKVSISRSLNVLIITRPILKVGHH